MRKLKTSTKLMIGMCAALLVLSVTSLIVTGTIEAYGDAYGQTGTGRKFQLHANAYVPGGTAVNLPLLSPIFYITLDDGSSEEDGSLIQSIARTGGKRALGFIGNLDSDSSSTEVRLADNASSKLEKLVSGYGYTNGFLEDLGVELYYNKKKDADKDAEALETAKRRFINEDGTLTDRGLYLILQGEAEVDSTGKKINIKETEAWKKYNTDETFVPGVKKAGLFNAYGYRILGYQTTGQTVVYVPNDTVRAVGGNASYNIGVDKSSGKGVSTLKKMKQKLHVCWYEDKQKYSVETRIEGGEDVFYSHAVNFDYNAVTGNSNIMENAPSTVSELNKGLKNKYGCTNGFMYYDIISEFFDEKGKLKDGKKIDSMLTKIRKSENYLAKAEYFWSYACNVSIEDNNGNKSKKDSIYAGSQDINEIKMDGEESVAQKINAYIGNNAMKDLDDKVEKYLRSIDMYISLWAMARYSGDVDISGNGTCWVEAIKRYITANENNQIPYGCNLQISTGLIIYNVYDKKNVDGIGLVKGDLYTLNYSDLMSLLYGYDSRLTLAKQLSAQALSRWATESMIDKKLVVISADYKEHTLTEAGMAEFIVGNKATRFAEPAPGSTSNFDNFYSYLRKGNVLYAAGRYHSQEDADDMAHSASNRIVVAGSGIINRRVLINYNPYNVSEGKDPKIYDSRTRNTLRSASATGSNKYQFKTGAGDYTIGPDTLDKNIIRTFNVGYYSSVDDGGNGYNDVMTKLLYLDIPHVTKKWKFPENEEDWRYEAANGTNVYIAGTHFSADPEPPTAIAPLIADVVLGFDDVEKNKNKDKDDILHYVKHEAEALTTEKTSNTNEKIRFGLNFHLLTDNDEESTADALDRLRDMKDKVVFYVGVSYLTQKNDDDNIKKNYPFWAVIDGSGLEDEKVDTVTKLDKIFSNNRYKKVETNKYSSVGIADGVSTTDEQTEYIFRITVDEMIKYIENCNIDSDTDYVFNVGYLDIETAKLMQEKKYSPTFRVTIYQIDKQEKIAENDPNKKEKIKEIIKETAEENSWNGDCVVEAFDKINDGVREKFKNISKMDASRTRWITCGATSGTADGYKSTDKPKNYTLIECGDNTEKVRKNHCYFSISKEVQEDFTGVAGNVVYTADKKHDKTLADETDPSAQRKVDDTATLTLTFNWSDKATMTLNEWINEIKSKYKTVAVAIKTVENGIVTQSNDGKQFKESGNGISAIKYPVSTYVKGKDTGVDGCLIELTIPELKELFSADGGKLPSRYSFIYNDWKSALVSIDNANESVLKSVSRVEMTVDVSIYGFEAKTEIDGKHDEAFYESKELISNHKVGYGAIRKWNDTSYKKHNMYLTIGMKEAQPTPPELATYRSIPLTYAEIKEGTVNLTGTNSFETYDVMSGVPSTEKIYFATGGSEFIVEITVGEVFNEQTERTYTSFFNTRDTGCKFMSGDALSGGGGVTTTKTLAYANKSVNNNVKSSSIKEWYNLPNPEGTSSYTTVIGSHDSSTTITAKWTGTIANTTSDPGILQGQGNDGYYTEENHATVAPNGNNWDHGEEKKGQPGRMNLTQDGNNYSWNVSSYNQALEQAAAWGKRLEEFSNGAGNVIKVSNSDEETRSWHVGEAYIKVELDGVNSPSANEVKTKYPNGTWHDSATDTSSFRDLVLETNDERLGVGYREYWGKEATWSYGGCITSHKTWTEYLASAASFKYLASWSHTCSQNQGSLSQIWTPTYQYAKPALCGATTATDATHTNCTISGPKDQTHVHSAEGGSCYKELFTEEPVYNAEGEQTGTKKVHAGWQFNCNKTAHEEHTDACWTVTHGTATTSTAHACTHSCSFSPLVQSTTKRMQNIEYTITVTFRESYTEGKNGRVSTPNGTLPAHALCGPCCEHGALPAVYDKWKQKLKYNYVQITNLNVYKISRSYVDGMSKITYDETDELIAKVENGDPNIFYNIAAMNTTYANSPQTAKKEASLSGRVRYSLQPQQHDDVTWDEKNPTVNEYMRSNDCDGQGSTVSAYNPCKVDKGGHERNWAKGILYNRKKGGAFTDDEKWLETIVTSDTKRKYTDNTLDETDLETVEYARFKKRRETKNTAYVVSDMLILQTSTGDNSILYYDMKETLTSQEHYDNEALNCTLSEAWYKNSKSAGYTGGTVESLIENSKIIKVGGYTGKYSNLDNKYSGGNYSSVSTIFDSNSAADATKTQTDDLARVQSAKSYSSVALATDQLNAGRYKSSPCWTYKSDSGQYGQLRMGKVSYFKTLIDDVQLNPVIINDDYTTGKAYQSYINILNYNITNENKTHSLYDGATDSIEFKYTDEDNDVLGYSCYKQEAYYFGKSKVNDLIIHTPVSNSGAMIISLGNDRDQRTNASEKGSLIGEATMDYCPGTPALCDHRYLDCKYLKSTVLYSTGFEDTTTVSEGFDTDGEAKVTELKSVYTDEEGVVHLIDSIGRLESELPDGFAIDDSNIFETGNALSCYGSSWGLKLSDIGYKYDKVGKLQVEFDMYMPSIVPDKDIMLISFENYGWYIPAGQLCGGWNINNDYNSMCSTSLIGTKARLKFIVDMNNANDSEFYIDGVKCTNFTTTGSSSELTSTEIGGTINIGGWGLDGDYEAAFYIDNLVITRPAGDTSHTSECYVTTYKCTADRNYTCLVPVEVKASATQKTFKAPQTGTYRIDVYAGRNSNGLGGMATGDVFLAKGQTVYIGKDGTKTYASYTSEARTDMYGRILSADTAKSASADGGLAEINSTVENGATYTGVSGNEAKVVITLVNHSVHNDDCNYEITEENTHNHTENCIDSSNEYLVSALNAAYKKDYTLLNKMLGSNIYSTTTVYSKLYDVHVHTESCVFTPSLYKITHYEVNGSALVAASEKHMSTSRDVCSQCGSDLIANSVGVLTDGTWSCNNVPLNGFSSLGVASTIKPKTNVANKSKEFETVIEVVDVDSREYTYSTGVQTFVPATAGEYTIEAYGAQGGGGYNNSTPGGYGGYAKSVVYLDSGRTLYVYAGTKGTDARSSSIDSSTGRGSAGGVAVYGRTELSGGYGGGSRGPGGGAGSGVFNVQINGQSEAVIRSAALVIAGGGGGCAQSSNVTYKTYSITPNSNGRMAGSNGSYGWYNNSYEYDTGGGGGGYYGGASISSDDPSTGYAGTNYCTGTESVSSYGVNPGNGKVVISWNIVRNETVKVKLPYNYTYYTYTGSPYTAPEEIYDEVVEFSADGWENVIDCLDGTSGGVTSAINGIKSRLTEIPLYVDGNLNPILACGNVYDVHVHKAGCYEPIATLNCSEPHHNGLHYDYTNSTCWSACNNDANHVVDNKIHTTGSGETYEQGEFINLDYGFKIYYPNTGDFYGTGLSGFSTLQGTRGRGYVDNCDTTRWVRSKSVMFDFDVLFYNENTGIWEEYTSGTWIDLPVTRAERDWHVSQRDIAITEYSFYCLLSNKERKSAGIYFHSEAINCEQSVLDKENVYYDDGTSNMINTLSNNSIRSPYTFEACEDCSMYNMTDIVGRIGNMLIVDTDDLRFCNFFKKVIDGEWIVEPLIHEVDNTQQVRYISVGDLDVRGIHVTQDDSNKFNTYGTQQWTAESIPYIKEIVSGDISNIKQLSGDEMKAGYDILFEVTTTGQYNSLEIAPYFYAYDTISASEAAEKGTTNHGVMPVDVWYAENDVVSAVNIYGLLNDSYYTNILRSKNQSMISDSRWIAFKQNGLSNYLLNLNWIDEKLRRNVSILEEQLTQSVCDVDGDWIPVGEMNDDGEYSGWEYSPKVQPYGTSYALGTLQLLTPGDRAKTYIGSSNTLDETFNGGNNTDLDDKIEDIEFTRNVQRWHLKLGAPSSSLFLPYSALFKGDNASAIHLNPLEYQLDGVQNKDILRELKNDGTPRYVILVGIDTIAIGNTWYLEYEAYKEPQVIKINGETITLDTSIKDIIAAYDAVDSSPIDVTITGTH